MKIVRIPLATKQFAEDELQIFVILRTLISSKKSQHPLCICLLLYVIRFQIFGNSSATNV